MADERFDALLRAHEAQTRHLAAERVRVAEQLEELQTALDRERDRGDRATTELDAERATRQGVEEEVGRLRAEVERSDRENGQPPAALRLGAADARGALVRARALAEAAAARPLVTLRLAVAADPAVSVVMVTHGGLDWTLKALDALQRHTPEPFETIVVDNASPGGLADRLAAEVEGLELVRNAENRGFGPACNQGAERARGPVLAFVNSDALVHRGWLAPLLSALGAPGRGGRGAAPAERGRHAAGGGRPRGTRRPDRVLRRGRRSRASSPTPSPAWSTTPARPVFW